MNDTRLTTRVEHPTPHLLKCGHPPMPSDGPGTGYARDPKTDERRCYPCSEAWQREQMKTADVWIGYTGEDRKRFATWSGGVLGKVTSYVTEERVRSTPSGGQYRMRHVTVQPWINHGPACVQAGDRRRQGSEGSS